MSSRVTSCVPLVVTQSLTKTVTSSPIVAGSKSLTALAQLNKTITPEEGKQGETGSQAISALKRLSAKVGMGDDILVLPHRSAEIRTRSSEHLSALEQLSKRVGGSGAPVLDPQTQIPLRYPRMDPAGSSSESGDKGTNESCQEDNGNSTNISVNSEEGEGKTVDHSTDSAAKES
ncbi:predicted protein [Nematostella vectensis]|uniref:Uncharacterized protein n=1 Tax=Nematostella vectensis TaxID=45351 RepID=A7RZ00_NEMVE|nr:predicted protein [Nematostella vectensis]|eukprot:XP_001635338.1 predicted protein [Nematostella vectensis]